MGNHRWFARTLPPARAARRSAALETSAPATGELAARLGGAAGSPLLSESIFVCGRKRWQMSATGTPATCVRFPTTTATPRVTATDLFIHFSDARIAALGARLRRSVRLILARRPARSALAQGCSPAAGRALGASHVTLHDAM